MDSPLVQLLSRTDLEGHILSHDDIRGWPAAERAAIFALGILQRIEDAEYVTCEVCPEAPYAEVISDIGPEPGVHCEGCGLRRISAERLHQWRVDFEALGGLLRSHLDLLGKASTLVPGRIWLLGRKHFAGRMAEFFLVQGIAWPDSTDRLNQAARLLTSPAPILVVPHGLPVQPEWRESGRAFLRLTEWASLCDGRIQICFDEFAQLYMQTAQAFERPVAPTPVADRPARLQQFCEEHKCTLKQCCDWANVDRSELNRWKNGHPSVPDGGAPATRIERLLQLGERV
ncbi:MAG: hypothetical protein ACP5VC_17435 [Bryobacteraceae bacterium]